MSAAKNWCFTFNNYSAEDIERIDGLVGTAVDIVYVLYGKETGENGTPHLQGFVTCKRKIRMNQIKGLIGGNPHVEVSRNVAASMTYCKKDGDFFEFGEREETSAGKRSDLDDFVEAVKGGMHSMKEIREAHKEVYAKYPRFCLEYVLDHAPQVELPEHELRPWQNALKARLEEPADRRKIIFVVDETGNSGKSWFAHYYTRQLGDAGQVILPGKKADMAYNLQSGLKVLFMDAPRSKQGEFIQYDFLEDLKNGFVFSPKYESRVKTYAPMHVVVNMNEQPDRSKLSADRYHVINIRQL